MERWGLLLINLGTPDDPSPAAVRRYLAEFLDDPRVIDLPGWKRWLLLNLVILPFRPRKSAEAYRKIWTERGSPLLFHGQDLVAKLQTALDAALGEGAAKVALAMRYQSPSILDALARFQRAGIDRIAVFPLFPHYASSSWGSAIEQLNQDAGRLLNVPTLQVLPVYYEHPAFVRAFGAVARPVLDAFQPDRVLLSYHGLPERHMRDGDLSGGQHCLASATCCDLIVPANRFCYRAQCYATTRALVPELGLADGSHEVSFQSRLGSTPWIQPFTDHRVVELAQAGVKKLAVLVPSFTADCLETLEEIAIRARAEFVAHGGEDLRLVPSLNSHDAWVEAILEMLREHAPGLATPTAAVKPEGTPEPAPE